MAIIESSNLLFYSCRLYDTARQDYCSSVSNTTIDYKSVECFVLDLGANANQTQQLETLCSLFMRVVDLGLQ